MNLYQNLQEETNKHFGKNIRNIVPLDQNSIVTRGHLQENEEILFPLEKPRKNGLRQQLSNRINNTRVSSLKRRARDARLFDSSMTMPFNYEHYTGPDDNTNEDIKTQDIKTQDVKTQDLNEQEVNEVNEIKQRNVIIRTDDNADNDNADNDDCTEGWPLRMTSFIFSLIFVLVFIWAIISIVKQNKKTKQENIPNENMVLKQLLHHA
jgi:hypothetical protein